MKLYVFVTEDIHPIGGLQNYLAGKVNYLHSHGWKALIFHFGLPEGTCAMPELNEYVSGGMLELGKPPEMWTKRIRNNALIHMEDEVRQTGISGDDIIIESSSDLKCLWGEMLAERLQAKHICFVCDEKFRGPIKYYVYHMGFFDFKHKRRELAGITDVSLRKLFAGYKEVNEKESYHFEAINEGPVRDVENAIVNSLKRYDWNICYIGRAEKPYVPKIIKDASIFCKRHPEKQIQFLMVGDASSQGSLLEAAFANADNVAVTLLGDLVPIPRKLYQLLDVVIAGSGCATCSVYEGVPVIVADAGNYMANGILGYTTFNTLFHEEGTVQTDFNAALEQVLMEKLQEKLEFKMPPLKAPEKYYDRHMEFIERSCQDREYYDPLCGQIKTDYIMCMKYYARKYMPFAVNFYHRRTKK